MPAIGDPGLPGHFELPQVGQMPENFQAAVSELATGILAQVQLLELRHAGEMQQAVVRQFARPSQVQARHEVETRRCAPVLRPS